MITVRRRFRLLLIQTVNAASEDRGFFRLGKRSFKNELAPSPKASTMMITEGDDYLRCLSGNDAYAWGVPFPGGGVSFGKENGGVAFPCGQR